MSKVKLIIFDLDGVLVEAKNIHYEALNDALFFVGKNILSVGMNIYLLMMD